MVYLGPSALGNRRESIGYVYQQCATLGASNICIQEISPNNLQPVHRENVKLLLFHSKRSQPRKL